MKILVTGSAGFIGSNLVLRLLNTESPIEVVGFDSVNDYYEVSLKEWRLQQIDKCAAEHPESRYTFIKGNLADKQLIDSLYEQYHFDVVVNLAAQAGVRHSIDNPGAYIESNLIGFYNILEACRHNPVQHLVYASSSSVYGGNTKVPFSEEDKVDNPVSLYAATKKSNELLAHAYSKLYSIPSTGLRFFTVYGPAGRPDMAYFGFTKRFITSGTPILRTYWILCRHCKKNSSELEFYRLTMMLRVTKNWFLCNQGMCQLLLQIQVILKRIWSSNLLLI